VEEFKAEHKVAFDEFKLFYESAEKVTDRRNAANRWNYSICIAILGVVDDNSSSLDEKKRLTQRQEIISVSSQVHQL
jgi:hypothetical protein